MLILAAGETEIEGVDATPPLSSLPPKPGTLFDIMPMHYRTQKLIQLFLLTLIAVCYVLYYTIHCHNPTDILYYNFH